MEFSLAFAIQEIPLVLFTALAPSGAVCMMVLMVMLLSHRFDAAVRLRVSQATWVPLCVTTVGLVAAAAHLGTPANALYVLAGVGRSPLSNEVACTVVFLAVCGVNWLASFAQAENLPVKRAFAVAIIALGAVFLGSVALAYSVSTVPTWSNPLVPVNLVLSGVVGGLLLARATLQFCVGEGFSAVALPRLAKAAGAVLAVNVALLLLQWWMVAGLSNAYGALADRAFLYPALVLAYGLLMAGAVVLALRGAGRVPLEAASGVLAIAGLLAVRFGFYLIHFTPGLAL